MLSEIVPRGKTSTVGSHLYTESKKAELIEMDIRMVVTKGWGMREGVGRFWSNNMNFQLYDE